MLRIGDLAILGVSLNLAACNYEPYPVLEQPPTPVGGFSEGPTMPSASFSYSSILLTNQEEVLVSGGGAISTTPLWFATEAVETFTLATGVWTSRPPIVGPRYGHQAVILDEGTIFVVGGQTNAPTPCQIGEPCASQPYLRSSGIFQLSCIPSPPMMMNSCSWEERPEMTYARKDFVALAVGQADNKKVLVSGGRADEIPLHAELFDVATGSWTTLTDSAHPIRLFHAGVLLSDASALLIGGIDKNEKPIAAVDRFDPAGNSWSAAGSLKEPRYLHTATSLGDGRVLITGGTRHGKDGALTSTEFYNESTNEWTLGPPMNEKRYGHAAALLVGNRRVLVVGGRGEVNGISKILASAEILDLETNTWTKIESPLARHWLPKIHVFPKDGRALVIGSAEIIDDQITHLPTAALYTPPCTAHIDCPFQFRCGRTRICIPDDGHSK